MTPEAVLSLCLFALVTSITPGPNNALLLASGLNFGLRRTVPHLLGVSLGFAVMQLALALGVGLVFQAVPGLYGLLRLLGLLYLLYLAWAIAHAAPPPVAGEARQGAPGKGAPGKGATDRSPGRPMTFLEASAFQWVNPKALLMCLTAAGSYVPQDRPVAGALMVTAAFLVLGLPCVGAWAALGVALRGLLQDRRRLRAFNWFMALALVASMAPLAQDMLRDGLF